MLKTVIAIDVWKLPIFKEVLNEAGYEYENVGNLTIDTLILKVSTVDLDNLAKVVKRANDKAAKSKMN